MYNKRKWLNSRVSDSTGSIVAFSGKVTHDNKKVDWTFLEISDCSNKIRLHQTTDDSRQGFINKMKLLKNEIELFIEYLEKSDYESS